MKSTSCLTTQSSVSRDLRSLGAIRRNVGRLRAAGHTAAELQAMIQSGLDISPVITHRFPYTQFKEAIELMKSGNSGKIVLDWSQLSS